MPKPVCEKCVQKSATVNVIAAFAGGRSSLPTSVQRLCKQWAAGFVNEAEKYVKRDDFSNGYDFESTFREKEPAPPNSKN